MMRYRNLAELLRRQAERLGPRTAVRFKRHGIFHDLSWADYAEQVDACAAALIASGVAPGDRGGLPSENRVEWLIADMGILAAAAVTVPLHAPLTARQVEFQLADAGVSRLFASGEEQLQKLEQIQDQLPELRDVWAFDA